MEQDKLSSERKKKRDKDDLKFYMWLAILAFYLIFINITFVSGLSMYPTLNDKDVLLMEKASIMFNNLQRGDIISFKENTGDKEVFFIKRIIGLPGEQVEIKDSSVYINGTKLEEIYLNKNILTELPHGLEELRIVLKEDEYFVLGDNRNNSVDSRYPLVGAVKKEDIAAKKAFKIINLG